MRGISIGIGQGIRSIATQFNMAAILTFNVTASSQYLALKTIGV